MLCLEQLVLKGIAMPDITLLTNAPIPHECRCLLQNFYLFTLSRKGPAWSEHVGRAVGVALPAMPAAGKWSSCHNLDL